MGDGPTSLSLNKFLTLLRSITPESFSIQWYESKRQRQRAAAKLLQKIARQLSLLWNTPTSKNDHRHNALLLRDGYALHTQIQN